MKVARKFLTNKFSMKFVILKINCDISEISIVQRDGKNIVFDTIEEIDMYLFSENLEQNDYSVLCIDRNSVDCHTILQNNQNKLS